MDQSLQGLAAAGETDLLVNNKFWGYGVPRQAAPCRNSGTETHRPYADTAGQHRKYMAIQ